MNEVWKDIPGFETRYQASNLGRIRSLTFEEKILSRWGTYMTRIHKGRILNSQNQRKNGYCNLKLGVGKSHDVHRLVALTFCPNPNFYTEVNHIDFDKTNNMASNLEWVNRSQNRIHNILNGRHNTVKLAPAQVLEIRSRISAGETMAALSKEYGLSYTNVKAIKNRKTWKYV